MPGPAASRVTRLQPGWHGYREPAKFETLQMFGKSDREREPAARTGLFERVKTATDGQRTILDSISNTSLLALRRIAPVKGSRIMLKLENENPTGRMKDRMALVMIEAAKSDGRLPAGGSVVEYTGGSTGISLSLICAVKGHPLHIVTSDAFSQESSIT